MSLIDMKSVGLLVLSETRTRTGLHNVSVKRLIFFMFSDDVFVCVWGGADRVGGVEGADGYIGGVARALFW